MIDLNVSSVLPRSVIDQGIDDIKVPDNGHGFHRLQERVGVNQDNIDYLKDVVGEGKRLCKINDECRRYANRKQMENPSDYYYVYEGFLYGFRKEYKTFLKERVEIELVTVFEIPDKLGV